MLKKNLIFAFIGMALVSVQATASQEQAVIEFEAKNYDVAKKLFKENKDDAQSQYYLALIDIEAGELEDAEEWLESALEQDDTNADYHYQFGWVNMRLAASASMLSAPFYASTAKESLKKALKLQPEHTKALIALSQFYIFAPSIAGGSFEKASELLVRLRALDKIEADLLYLQMARKQEDKDKQIAMAKQIEQEYAESARALLSAGFVMQQQERYEDAFRMFKVASQQAPKDEQDSSIARALYQMGKTAVLSEAYLGEGAKALSMYLSLEKGQKWNNLPTKGWARFRLAQVVAKQGDKPQALSLIDLASKDNDDDDLKKELKALKKELS